MESNELEAALADVDTKSTTSRLQIDGGPQTEPPPVTSPYVVNMDTWGQNKGRRLSFVWDGEEEWEVARARVASDAHASLFEPNPSIHEHPEDSQRSEWWKQLMESPEFKALRNQTCLDGTLSEIGAKNIYDQWWQYRAKNEPPKPDESQPGSEGESVEDSLARIRSCAQAIAGAEEAIQDAKDAGAGLGMGTNGNPLDPKKLAEYFKQVREHPKLREIMRMAGRMRALSQALQRTKINHGQDDMIGIELGGDIARLVPSELTQLVSDIEEIELLTLNRIAQKQALCRKYQGLEKLGKGPIVVVVDESGSMEGQKEIAAKALALSMAWLANQQNRWIALVGFSGGKSGTRVAFPPGKMNQKVLIEWITHFYGGGTHLDVPLAELPFVYWKQFVEQGMARGKTDVIIITDAKVRCSTQMQKDYQKWSQQEQVTTYGIVIGKHGIGDLGAVCQHHWNIPNLDLDSMAVETVLSI